MKRDILEAIDELWSRDFPDLPWMAQPLRIDVRRCGGGGPFHFLIDGGTGSFSITPVVAGQAGNAGSDLAASDYSLELAPDDAGILLGVTSAAVLDHVRLEQVGEGSTPARVVCLWRDLAAGQWEVVHNAIDREKLLLQETARLLAGRKLPFADDLLRFMTHLLAMEFGKAAAVFEGSPALRRQQAGLQRLCERFEMQLNAHGMKRTFRFWAPAQKTTYLEGTRALMQALDSLSGHVCLGFGAVLGLVRDQDLIGHDDDLDILIAFDSARMPDLGQALAATEKHLEDHGHRVQGRFFSHLWVQTPDGNRADVFVGLIEGDGSLSFYPSARHSLRAEIVFPANPANLCGVTLPVPANCEAYLVGTYGGQWRKPDIGFAHPWDRAAYADIAGMRARPAMWTRGELARRNRTH